MELLNQHVKWVWFSKNSYCKIIPIAIGVLESFHFRTSGLFRLPDSKQFLRSSNLCFTLFCRFRLMLKLMMLKGNLNVKEYKKITSVLLSEISLNVHEPKNDWKRKGPLVIFIAVTFGRLNVTYSVSIPIPFFATQYAFTPLPAAVAFSTRSAFIKKVSQVKRLL
jgi:hypothetical protein